MSGMPAVVQTHTAVIETLLFDFCTDTVDVPTDEYLVFLVIFAFNDAVVAP